MTISSFNLDQDLAKDHIENKLSFEITSLSSAQASNINAFVAKASDTGILNNAQGTPTTTPLSSAFRHIANYYFSSTASVTVPVAHNANSTTTLLRAIQVGRTTMDDGIVSGTVTAVFAFGTSANNTFIDIPESTLTGSLGRKGSLVSQTTTSNIVGTVFYDTGSLIFHGGTGSTYFLTDSTSGFTFGAASAAKIVCTQLSFKSLNVLKRGSYFCRAFNKEFNYTNNPTAISSQVLGSITASLTSNPTTYITSVGLYNDAGDLLAIAKLSPPLRKNFQTERIIEVRTDW